MKPPLVLLLTLLLVSGGACRARAANSPPPAIPAVREMRIAPGTTGVPLGEARLTVEPLIRVPGKDGLSAAYRVDITPWTFKSEAGRFSVAISEADIRRLSDGATLHFTGQAVSQDGSNTSAVEGRATPSTGGAGGAIRIQVEGEKGKLVFHTTYRLGR